MIMEIYIDKGLREVSSKGRQFKGDKCSPKFSPENCVGNWDGEKMRRIVNFSTSDEFMNSYVLNAFKEELPFIQFENISKPAPLATSLEENKYLNKLFKSIEQIIEPKHKYVIISTHQYRLKDLFAFDKEKYADQMGNKTKIGFKNCTCIEVKFDGSGTPIHGKVVWTPKDDGDPKYYYLSSTDKDFMGNLKKRIPRNVNLANKVLLFIRHGEAHHNLETVKNAPHQAKVINSPLTKRGISQARELHQGISKIYKDLNFFQNRDKILFMSSPLDRAIQTLLVACGPVKSVQTINSIFARMKQIEDTEPGYFNKLGCYLRQTMRLNRSDKNNKKKYKTTKTRRNRTYL
jgi:broad specificity phosphatase PhoE